jgi:hypothetical protein
MIELEMSCRDARVITDIMQNTGLDKMVEWTSTTTFEVNDQELAEEILETIFEIDRKLEIEIL